MPTVTLTIDSDLNNIPLVGVSIRAIAGLSMDDEAASMVELSVVEAVTNVVRHAYNGEHGQPILIRIGTTDRRIRVEIVDIGLEMPAESLERHKTALDFDPDILEHVPTSGMGLAIIMEVMDEVTYTRSDNKNTLSMTKTYNPPEADR